MYFQELFGKKFKRFNDDGINSALNYGYALLRSLISSKIVAKGFHPSLGIHHKSQLNNYNFADDIIEIFIVDGDFDRYIKKEEMIEHHNFIYLETYNIENYFIDENVKIEIPELRIDDYEY